MLKLSVAQVVRKHPIPPNPLTDHMHELLPFYITGEGCPGCRWSPVVVGPGCRGPRLSWAQVVLEPSVRATQVVVRLKWSCCSSGRVAQVVVSLKWSCRSGRRAAQAVVSLRRSCRSGGRVAQVDVPLRRSCRPGGRVAQVDVPLRHVPLRLSPRLVYPAVLVEPKVGGALQRHRLTSALNSGHEVGPDSAVHEAPRRRQPLHQALGSRRNMERTVRRFA